MNFKVLGSSVEYDFAVKRLEALRNAAANSPEAKEMKELAALIKEYERDLFKRSKERSSK
ncbi:hypothetical protein [Adhaeribacter aquaticus]|uniref:hypothetical protein n=1 Tax=Adhaeribacter aquaticus TaxID=299567 RepID=UPI0012F77E33|nr:hypothetical protein [Adhaeribacter aquaticus]